MTDPVSAADSHLAAMHAPSIVLRNNRTLIAFTWLGCIVVAFFSACMVILFFATLFPDSHERFSFKLVAAAISWLFGAFFMVQMSVYLAGQARSKSFPKVTLDAHGAAFLLGSRKRPETTLIPWDSIASVSMRRMGGGTKVIVVARTGGSVSFSSFDFYRPKTIAAQIAERVGVPVTRA